MKRIVTLSFLLGGSLAFGQNQGLVNQGANIVLKDGANIYIDGSNGHYTAYTQGTTNHGLIRTNDGSGGGSHGVIKVSGNWFNDSGADGFANDGTTVELIGGSQIIRGSHLTNFDTLRLLGTDDKILLQNTKVGGLVAKNGRLELNDKKLELNEQTLTITNASNAAITRSTGFVQSETANVIGSVPDPAGGPNIDIADNKSVMAWEVGTNTGTYIYPFGTLGNGDFIPVSINKTSSESNVISVATRKTATSNNHPWVSGITGMGSAVLGVDDATDDAVIDRWWEINPSNTALQADITLSYDGAENTTTNTNPVTGTFALQQWVPSISDWGLQIGSGATVVAAGTIGAVTATGVQFNPGSGVFVLSSLNPNGPLPVTLTDFSVMCNDEDVVVKWVTASELNSDFFMVQRSRNGYDWETIAEVDAAGNSVVNLEYEVVDKNAPGQAYYKLVQVDLDGNQEDFGPISSNCSVDKDNMVNLFPNPNNGKFTLEVVNNFNDENAFIQIMDLSGRIVEMRDAVFANGTNQLIFDSHSFVKGTYVLRIVSDYDYTPIKFVVF